MTCRGGRSSCLCSASVRATEGGASFFGWTDRYMLSTEATESRDEVNSHPLQSLKPACVSRIRGL